LLFSSSSSFFPLQPSRALFLTRPTLWHLSRPCRPLSRPLGGVRPAKRWPTSHLLLSHLLETDFNHIRKSVLSKWSELHGKTLEMRFVLIRVIITKIPLLQLFQIRLSSVSFNSFIFQLGL
jgi:hypothetical protein